MKQFKKIAAFLLCGALVGSLAACNGGGGTKAPVAVTMWHYYNGAQQDTLNSLVEEFNESVGAEKGIVVEAHGFGKIADLTQNALDALYKKVGADTPPELFAAYADTAYEINAAGMAADVGQYLSEEERGAYIPAYFEEGRFDADGFKIFPVAKSVEVLTLNKTEWDRFAADTKAEEAGLATWEGLAEIAKTYYEW
ncbi:MAG: ABC transporter substrate-binding protein, partial [Oscillospiraceae bacterium]